MAHSSTIFFGEIFSSVKQTEKNVSGQLVDCRKGYGGITKSTGGM